MKKKIKLENGYILEWSITQVEDKKYPDGYKYRLIAISDDGEKRILITNDHPKGHRYSDEDNEEYEYTFIDIDKLFDFFGHCVKEHMGADIWEHLS
jgi:hypothetical protein